MMPCFRVGDQILAEPTCVNKKKKGMHWSFECSGIRLNRRGRHSESLPVIQETISQ